MADQIQNTSAATNLDAYDPAKYCVVPDDSNLQSTGVAGGTDADNAFETTDAGSDLLEEETAGPGGISLM